MISAVCQRIEFQLLPCLLTYSLVVGSANDTMASSDIPGLKFTDKFSGIYPVSAGESKEAEEGSVPHHISYPKPLYTFWHLRMEKNSHLFKIWSKNSSRFSEVRD